MVRMAHTSGLDGAAGWPSAHGHSCRCNQGPLRAHLKGRQHACPSGAARGESSAGMTHPEEFAEFAAAVGPRLRRTAFLLCGDWHVAEDLTQATLAKVFVSWRRISRRDAAHAYATRTLANTFLADRRRKR